MAHSKFPVEVLSHRGRGVLRGGRDALDRHRDRLDRHPRPSRAGWRCSNPPSCACTAPTRTSCAGPRPRATCSSSTTTPSCWSRKPCPPRTLTERLETEEVSEAQGAAERAGEGSEERAPGAARDGRPAKRSSTDSASARGPRPEGEPLRPPPANQHPPPTPSPPPLLAPPPPLLPSHPTSPPPPWAPRARADRRDRHRLCRTRHRRRLRELGSEVWCVDIDAEKVARLRAGETPKYEPGLQELLARKRAHALRHRARGGARRRAAAVRGGRYPADLLRRRRPVGRARGRGCDPGGEKRSW